MYPVRVAVLTRRTAAKQRERSCCKRVGPWDWVMWAWEEEREGEVGLPLARAI